MKHVSLTVVKHCFMCSVNAHIKQTRTKPFLVVIVSEKNVFIAVCDKFNMHGHDCKYNALCYTSRRALAGGTKNSTMDPP